MTIKVLTTHQRWFELGETPENRAYQVLRSWLEDDEVQRFLRVNRYQDVLWFNEEAFEQLLWWMMVVATVDIAAHPEQATASPASPSAAEAIAACYEVIEELRQAEEASSYRVERLLEAARA
jgi:hypothetical protein